MLSSAAALPEAKPWRASSSRAKGTEKEVLRGAENSVKSCGGCWVEWRKGARAQLTAAAGRKGAGLPAALTPELRKAPDCIDLEASSHLTVSPLCSKPTVQDCGGRASGVGAGARPARPADW